MRDTSVELNRVAEIHVPRREIVVVDSVAVLQLVEERLDDVESFAEVVGDAFPPLLYVSFGKIARLVQSRLREIQNKWRLHHRHFDNQEVGIRWQ